MDDTHSIATEQPAVNTVLVRRCAWCQCVVGTKDGEGIAGETSTICPDCATALLQYTPALACHWCGKTLNRHDLRSKGGALPQPLCHHCYWLSGAGIEIAKTEKGD